MKMTQQQFINKIGLMATADMQKTGILASLTIAQAILESAWGNSGLTVKANNLFGIKGKYNGQGYICKTFEYYNGKRVNINAEFRKYPSWVESLADHSALFHRLPRYKNLINCKDYKQACRNVQADGYATAPNYADSLIRLIEQYNLTRFDKVAENASTVPNKPTLPPPNYYNYTVKKGDSFWSIAKDKMKSGLRMYHLAKFNGLKITSTIRPEQVLRIPK